MAGAALLALSVVVARGAEGGALTRAAFLPHWIPQAQFAGCYMAVDKGIFQKHGLEVAVLEGGPRAPVDKALVSGDAVFASHFLSSALKLREQGVPVVNLAQLTQKSALMLVAFKSRVGSVRDLEGKKVSVWPDFSAQPQALFRKYNLNVRTLTQGPTINLFLRGGVDAASAMWYNEYHQILNSGVNAEELTLIFFDQHGLNFPEDGLYCLAETWRTRPEVCRKFVQAVLEGWEYAFAHPDESLAAVMRRVEAARTGANRAHQRWMLQRMRDLIKPDGRAAAPGSLAREDYERVCQELKTGGAIQRAPAFEEFYVGANR